MTEKVVISVCNTVTCAILAAMIVALFSGCTQQQVATDAKYAVIAQGVLDAACTNNTVEQMVAAAVPEVGVACVGERMASPVVAKVLSDPALVAKVVAVSQRIKL